jgi:hypothetical protein
MWKRVELYKATALESFDEPQRELAAVPEGAAVQHDAPLQLRAVIGREVLSPDEETRTLLRFVDGGAAITRSEHGAGAAWVVGLFPGLEYSAPLRTARYDMSRDLEKARREFIALPCRGRVRPVVDCDHPAIEGVLLRNKATGKLAVTLMNWNYRIAEPAAKNAEPTVEFAPRENVKLRIRGTGPVASVRSAASGATLAATHANEVLSLTLPRLDEGDVLLFDAAPAK